MAAGISHNPFEGRDIQSIVTSVTDPTNISSNPLSTNSVEQNNGLLMPLMDIDSETGQVSPGNIITGGTGQTAASDDSGGGGFDMSSLLMIMLLFMMMRR